MVSGIVRCSTTLVRRLLSQTNHGISLQSRVLSKNHHTMCYSDTHSYLTNKRCTRLRRHISTTKSLAKNTVKVKFIDRDGDAFTVNAEVGSNLMKVAHKHDIDLEGACDGTLSCCTCHLVVHPDWYDKLGSEPCEDELDMLDMAYGLTDTSRLGCQVQVTEEMSGLVVRIPPYEPQYT